MFGTGLAYFTFRKRAFRKTVYAHCLMTYTMCPEWGNAITDMSFEDPRGPTLASVVKKNIASVAP